MHKILDKVNIPEDLRKLNIKEKTELAEEIREFVIDTVSKTGGHLASNLGVVELTIALHSIFNTPTDKIIWDVGHQVYVHKILTGRKDKLDTLRQLDGVSGFPKTCESEYDCFDTGHSSTSISAALGMARARDIKKEDNKIIAVIGDGALTGGMALEAINDAGSSNNNLIVILNDNEMSISKNVGGISTFLTKLRAKRSYNRLNIYTKRIVEKIPFVGKYIIKGVRTLKYTIKKMVIPNMFFEDLGFRYLGPVDGHNIEKIEYILEKAKDLDGPILIHILTKKGKGYLPAELNPGKFHGISSFDKETGKTIKPFKPDYSKVFGDKLVELAKKDDRIVAITAAMTDGTGLTKFSKEFPNRFFDVGIAEQHSLTMAAGLAINGLKPVISIYSSFYQRGFDQVIHDICIQNLPVVMCVDRAGIVGNDGETHQGILDLAFFNIIPNITIMAPKDFKELEDMLEYALSLNLPVVIRYPRGGEAEEKFETHEKIQFGKAEVIKQGNDLSIIAIGKMVSRAKEVANILEKEKIDVEIINARFLKPLDEKLIIQSVSKTGNCITIEDGILKSGLYSTVMEIMQSNNIENVNIKGFGYPDEFIKHGDTNQIEEMHGLDANSISKYVIQNIIIKV